MPILYYIHVAYRSLNVIKFMMSTNLLDLLIFSCIILISIQTLILLQVKVCTIKKVLKALELIFTREGTLSQHGERLVSQLAKLPTHHSVLGVSSSEERDDRTLALLEKMILTQWKL